MSALRLWFGMTAVLLAGAMIWAFAPILVLVIGLLAVLGGLVAAIVWAARAFEKRRGTGARRE